MGSTFCAVHVRGISATALAETIEARILDEGAYERVSDDVPPSETDRLVLVFDDGNGWGVVADADFELDPEGALAAAKALSKAHATDALLIAVHHSDTALLARFRKGRSRGELRVPEDARLDKKSGHRQVEATFLEDLAESKEAKAALSAPVLADRTFPEDTVLELARHAGLHAAGAGARYLWHEPPEGALRLRFAPVELEPAAFVDWRPPGAEGQAMSLQHQPAVDACVGAPLENLLHFTLQAHEGPRVEGLRVELGGPGLALLSLAHAKGWNPDLSRQGPGTEVVEAPLTREGEHLVARFPRGSVEAQGVPTMADFSPAAFRQWSQSLAGHHARQFHLSLDGTAQRAGTGELRVRVTRLDGAALPVSEGRVRVSVRPAPRMPLLPEGKPAFVDGRVIEALETYAGNAWVAGWLAFDATWAELGDFVLEATTTLARQVAGAGELELSVTSAGTHPTVRKRFRRHAHLAHKDFAVAVKHLANEAQVHLHQPYDAMVGGAAPLGYVVLTHQPHGNTIFDPETRKHFDAQRPRPRLPPLVVSFAMSAPTELRELETLVRASAAQAACVGALLCPSGPAPHPGPLAWETLLRHDSFSDDLELVRHHVRAPGWLTLAPGKAAQRVEPSSRVEVTRVASGALLASRAATPRAMTDEDRAAMERAVLPALASKQVST